MPCIARHLPLQLLLQSALERPQTLLLLLVQHSAQPQRL
jgi:hypothetical protein